MTKLNSVLSWRLLLPIVAVLALALLAACGGAATEAPEATAAPVATTAPATQQTAAPAQPTAAPTAAAEPTEAPQAMMSEEPEGQLVLGLTSYGNEVPIPWQEIAFAKNYGRFIWDYLIGTTDDAQLSTETGLAEEWTMAEDGLSWNFKLRQGVPFQNGEEFIAEDIKFALDQTMVIPEAPASYKNQLLCCVTENGIDLVNDYEFNVRMDKPQIFLDWDLTDAQGNLGVPVDKSHYDAVGEDEYARNPIHTGVYQWTDHLKGDFIEMTYWGEHWREGVPLVGIGAHQDYSRREHPHSGSESGGGGCHKPFP